MRPELFRLTDAGHATALVTELRDDDQVEAALEVAECCPVEAIVLAVAKRRSPALDGPQPAG